jgi:serine/threonine-protein kinase RsbW
VPGSLEFRDVAVRVVGTACRLLRPVGSKGGTADRQEIARGDFTHDEFATQVVSAFSEAYNNLAIHGYRSFPQGPDRRIELEIASRDGAFVVTLRDFAAPYDPGSYSELPDELPERGMGLYIIRSFMDAIEYVAGPPNVLTLVKRWPGPASDAPAPDAPGDARA